MGLSLRNFGKKITDVVQGVERQVNPFDNGMTYKQKTPTGNANVFQQATHNGLTNFVGQNIVEPVARAPINASAQLYQHFVAPTFDLPQLPKNKISFNPTVQGIGHELGATGSLHQTLGDTTQLGLTLAAPGIGNAVEGAVGKVLPEAASPLVARFAPKVTSSAAISGGFNAAATAGQGGNVKDVIKGGAEGAALGAAIPVAGAAVKPVVRAVPQAIGKIADTADKAKTSFVKYNDSRQVGAEPPALPAEPLVKPPKPSPTPNVVKTFNTSDVPPVAMKTAPARTDIPQINKRINDMATVYSTPSKFSGSVADVVRQAKGQSQNAMRSAYALRGSLEKHLTAEERAQVSDLLDGAIKTASPHAEQVAKSLKPLYDRGFAVRKAINPNVNKVQDYVTRLPRKSIGAAVRGTKRALGQINNLSDIHNLNSVFSQERRIGKFVGAKGKTLYGNPTNVGLVSKGENAFVDKVGNKFKQVAVSKRELEQAGVGTYEHDIGRISGIYHGDTASLKIRGEALNALKTNPENYGLYTLDKAPEGAVPVRRIPELDGLYAKPEDVKALEDGFGHRNASGLAGKAYDAVANTVQQFIVVNPFFHGMNQLYQTGIAAGNMPGMGTGWMKTADAVINAGEKDARDYLMNGGHIPDYGTHHENWLSQATQGLTKLNSRAMHGIETKLRVGLYKASVESGMSPKAAVENIDRFLGDPTHIDPTIRRATLFAHYFKTMATAVGHQAAHPIEQKGSIANAVGLAAITAAVTYGWREFTGNQDAYVRVPGELGLLKEGVRAVGEVGKGELPSIVTNRVNPVLKEGIQQATNHDFFTQGKVSDTQPVKVGKVTVSPNVTHAAESLIAPMQVVERGASGRRSLAETAGNQLGVYEPHARGHQATSNPELGKVLNTKGAIKGTGMKEQNAYFDGLKQVRKDLAGDKKASTALEYYLAKNRDPATGQTIQNSPSESIQNASAMFANDKLRTSVQKFEKSQPSHDPIWDLPPDKLKKYMQYKEQFTGDAAKKFLLSQADNGRTNWIKDVQTKEQKFYENLPKVPGGQPPEPSSQTPPYPKFSKQTQSLLDQYDGLDGKEASNFIAAHPEIVDAFSQVSDWTNKMRKSEGAPELKTTVQADPTTQKIIDYYNSLPKGDGPKGGNKTRSLWIQSHPGEYAKMQDFFTKSSLQSLIKNASLDQFKGSTENQKLLKSIYNLGKYDVVKNADGTYSLGSSGGSSPYASYRSSSSRSIGKVSYKGERAMLRSAHYAARSHKPAKIKGTYIKLSKGHRGHASKSLNMRGAPKVSLKHSKV